MLPSSPERDPKKPSPTRIVIWVVGAGAGLYLLVSGVIGILNPG